MNPPPPAPVNAPNAPNGPNARKPVPPPSTGPIASLSLGKFVFFDYYYTWVYLFLEYLLFVYKGFRFYYPPKILSVEVVSLTFLMVYQFARLHFGSTGNKREEAGAMAWFLILTAPAIIGYVFYLKLQTYVLLIDTILSATSLVFIALEVIFGIFSLITFKLSDKLE